MFEVFFPFLSECLKKDLEEWIVRISQKMYHVHAKNEFPPSLFFIFTLGFFSTLKAIIPVIKYKYIL